VNYLRTWVLAAFRAEHPNERNPTASDLDSYDTSLFNIYETEIQKQTDPNIPLNPFNRSILVYFATRSEATAAFLQVKHAYEFYRNNAPITP
jgi:hypothetical protein